MASPSAAHSAPGAAAEPLFALGPTFAELPRIESPARLPLATRLRGLAKPLLWLRGEEGAGRTLLLDAALRSLAAGGEPMAGAFRIGCWPGLRVEELLFLFGDFLSQLGVGHLSDVLLQRTPLASKVRVLASILRSHPVWWVLDDFENLDASSAAPERDPLRLLISSFVEGRPHGGKLVLVSGSLPPPQLSPDELGAEVFDLAGAPPLDTAELWRLWTLGLADLPAAAALPDLDALPAETRRHPLSLRILACAARARANGDAAIGAEAFAGAVGAGGISRLVAALRPALAPAARAALDFLCLYGRPASLGTLKALCEAWPQTEVERAVETLRAWGLLELGDGDGRRLELHPEVARAALRHLRAEHPELARRLLRLIGDQHLAAASRSRSHWGFYAAYQAYLHGGAFAEAYEVQKTFSEEFLSLGYLDVARKVFEDCRARVGSPYREILTGNLAIIHKGEGRYDEAIRLYQESLEEFTLRDDLANAARVHHQVGNTLYLKGDLDAARDSYRRCLDIASAIGDANVSFLGLVQLANLEFSSGRLPQARDMYRQALAVPAPDGSQALFIALRLQLAQVLIKLSLYPEAEEELSSAEAITRKLEDRRGLLKIEELRGLMAKLCRDYDKALRHFEEGAKHALALGDPIEQANCLIQTAQVEDERLRFAEALRALLDARDVLAALSLQPLSERARASLKRNLDAVETLMGELRQKLGVESFERLLAGLGRSAVPPSS
jgi:tetratricopeptide (TPR) repeat protein